MTIFETIRTVNASVRGWPYKRVECKDGFSISVQAHDGAYCEPQSNNGAPYTSFECVCDVGRVGKEMMRYYDPDWEIFGYVPVRVVVELIAIHGGEVDHD